MAQLNIMPILPGLVSKRTNFEFFVQIEIDYREAKSKIFELVPLSCSRFNIVRGDHIFTKIIPFPVSFY